MSKDGTIIDKDLPLSSSTRTADISLIYRAKINCVSGFLLVDML